MWIYQYRMLGSRFLATDCVCPASTSSRLEQQLTHISENFRRSSAEGLSVEFIIIWLAGDVFNILGAVLQGVLPTMIVLAIYCGISGLGYL